jgi:hypothetical protein
VELVYDLQPAAGHVDIVAARSGHRRIRRGRCAT